MSIQRCIIIFAVILTAATAVFAAISPGMKPGELRINANDNAKMVWIPAGEFYMGLSKEEVDAILKSHTEYKASWFADEQPRHKVILDGYWIYKYEVTVGQYRKFCKDTGREMPHLVTWAKDDFPMMNVTWDDAAAYAEWAGGRLPTEAEWEKAARGGDRRLFPWGNAWHADWCNNYSNTQPIAATNKKHSAAPVGSFPRSVSPYGVEDMAGNVWEWCQDWYAEDYYANAPAKNPQGPETGELRVLRGGSWGSSSRSIRSTARHADAPDLTYHDDGGFRCVILATAK